MATVLGAPYYRKHPAISMCDEDWLSPAAGEAVPDLLQWIKPNCQKQFAKWAFWPAI